eukprot:TRINITY_DN11642_c0_g1_i1.p1 TRINITY_DN11642_c0_g1~~TRINITY_DN11642_c0_g1_i1.p1  ORF type:complete len:576 (+),score=90.12 TRINITY_DN11642_c0_g1_i1:47-1774(+)
MSKIDFDIDDRLIPFLLSSTKENAEIPEIEASSKSIQTYEKTIEKLKKKFEKEKMSLRVQVRAEIKAEYKKKLKAKYKRKMEHNMLFANLKHDNEIKEYKLTQEKLEHELERAQLECKMLRKTYEKTYVPDTSTANTVTTPTRVFNTRDTTVEHVKKPEMDAFKDNKRLDFRDAEEKHKQQKKADEDKKKKKKQTENRAKTEERESNVQGNTHKGTQTEVRNDIERVPRNKDNYKKLDQFNNTRNNKLQELLSNAESEYNNSNNRVRNQNNSNIPGNYYINTQNNNRGNNNRGSNRYNVDNGDYIHPNIEQYENAYKYMNYNNNQRNRNSNSVSNYQIDKRTLNERIRNEQIYGNNNNGNRENNYISNMEDTPKRRRSRSSDRTEKRRKLSGGSRVDVSLDELKSKRKVIDDVSHRNDIKPSPDAQKFDYSVFNVCCAAYNFDRCHKRDCNKKHACANCYQRGNLNNSRSHPVSECKFICKKFNSGKGKCIKNCRYTHVCLVCLGDHPVRDCRYCRNWTRNGRCTNQTCRFKHSCAICGSTSHSLIDHVSNKRSHIKGNGKLNDPDEIVISTTYA